jgi:hypothetical protein
MISEQEIAQMYSDNNTIHEIMDRTGLGEKKIRNSIKRQKVDMRPIGKRPIELDKRAFDTITDESAYWIGFLMADGCVTHNSVGSPVLSLTLQRRDEKHLEKFGMFLKTNAKIYRHISNADSAQSSVKFVSPELCSALLQYGVTPRKALTASPPEQLLNNRHFWRGIIDGDGHVSIIKGDGWPVIHLAGTSIMCNKFLEFAKTISPVPSSATARLMGKTRTYQVALHASKSIPIIVELYRDCSMYLDRKEAVYRDIASKLCPCCGAWNNRLSRNRP